MTWDRKTYGTCSRCGGKLTNPAPTDNATIDLSDDDDSVRLHLVKYRGKFMCSWCKNYIQRHEGSKRRSRKSTEESKFRQRIGFKKTI